MATHRLIIADDHAVVRSGIAHAVSVIPEVIVVAEVGTGPALLAAIPATQPTCLLIDISMPGFDPIGDVRQIRAAHPDVKILIVSAYDDDYYVQGLLSLGVNGYHLKDQPLADLRLAVERVLAGERWVCSPLVAKLVQIRSAPTVSIRQRELLQCLQAGLDNHGIARQTGLSVKTVENQLTRLYRQLGVQSRLEAVSYVSQNTGLLMASAPQPEAGAGIRLALLIVDDNERYRTQLRRMIGKAYPHALLLEAGTTAEAVRQAEHAPPKLAFVDVVLGDESGIECVRLLHDRTPATRLVLFSAYPDREFHRQGLGAGAVAFLDKKDVDAAALRELIDDALLA